jgi:hypothetical protein
MQADEHHSCYPTPFAESFDEDETREIYARFGLATYVANVLDEALSNCLVVFEFAFRPGAGRAGVEDFQAEVARETMGRKVTRLEASPHPPPAALIALLRECVNERNDLVHRFMAEKCTKWYSAVGRSEMIAELNASVALFQRADKDLEREYLPRAERLNITEDRADALVERLVADERARDGGSDVEAQR